MHLSLGAPCCTRASKLSRNDWYRLERALAVAESVIDGQTDGSSTTGHKERPVVYSGVARGPLRERYTQGVPMNVGGNTQHVSGE